MILNFKLKNSSLDYKFSKIIIRLSEYHRITSITLFIKKLTYYWKLFDLLRSSAFYPYSS